MSRRDNMRIFYLEMLGGGENRMFVQFTTSKKWGVERNFEQFEKDCRNGLTNWSTIKKMKEGDNVFFYFGKPYCAIKGYGIRGQGAPKKKRNGHFYANYRSIGLFKNPLTLDAISRMFPKWKAWKNLYGRTGMEVPDRYQKRLMDMLRSTPPAVPVEVFDDAVDFDRSGNRWPERTSATVVRFRRDTKNAKRLKEIYKNTCQVCGTVLRLRNDKPYSEAHHLRPLGGKHKGKDNVSNMLVLCPNHHAQFDYGGMAIDPATMKIKCAFRSDPWHGKRFLKAKGHPLEKANLAYTVKLLAR